MIGEIGFVGLGSMGRRMVQRFLEHGLAVWVHDIDEAAVRSVVALGAKALPSPSAVASQVELVLVSLPTPDVVRKVALAANGIVGGNKVRTYVDLSTTGTEVAREVGEALAARGIDVLDAPVGGGPIGVENGTLAIMVAGDRVAYERVRPVLTVIGSQTTLVGDKVGQGQTLKLLNNLLVATTYAAACEAAVLGAKAGLDPAVMIDLLNKSSARSWVTEELLAKHGVTRTFGFGFRLSLMLKDIGLALEDADQLGIAMSTSRAAAQIWDQALKQGDPDRDYTTLLRVIEDLGGATVGADKP